MNTIQFFANKYCSETASPIDTGHRPSGTDLFELQVWLVDIGDGQAAWCGSLQNVQNGENHYFKGWSGLVANLQGILTPFAQLEVLKAVLPIEEIAY